MYDSLLQSDISEKLQRTHEMHRPTDELQKQGKSHFEFLVDTMCGLDQRDVALQSNI